MQRNIHIELRIHNVHPSDSNQELKRRVRELLQDLPYRVTLGKPQVKRKEIP